MSLRPYLIVSISTLMTLLGVDVALDCLNWGSIPIRVHDILVAVILIVSIAMIGTVLGRTYSRGIELGQHLRPSDLEHDTDSVVVPMPRERQAGARRRA